MDHDARGSEAVSRSFVMSSPAVDCRVILPDLFRYRRTAIASEILSTLVVSSCC